MPWTNGPLTVYHGCDDRAALSIQAGINMAHCRPLTDFGIGFYTTTSFRQAAFWANGQYRRNRRRGAKHAVVLQFDLLRLPLGEQKALVFVTENTNPDYWDFVTHNRTGAGPHQSSGYYSVVYGPVSLWPQLLVIKDCDQISFHDEATLSVLLKSPKTAAEGTANDPLLRP
jgi:Protein of unknown function (DUF3990)